MDITDKKVAILVDDYFEQAEFEEPLMALREANAEVTVIAARHKELHGLNHVEMGDPFTADLLLREANPEEYDALVLPGGAINADSLRVMKEAQRWVTSFLEADKPLAAICHAPWLLVSADAVDDRWLTSYFTIQDDIQNAGGKWLDQPVVIDGYLITSRRPDDLPAFTKTLIMMLERGLPTETADAIQGQDDDPAVPVSNERATEGGSRLKALGNDRSRGDLSLQDKRDILDDEYYDNPGELHVRTFIIPDEHDEIH